MLSERQPLWSTVRPERGIWAAATREIPMARSSPLKTTHHSMTQRVQRTTPGGVNGRWKSPGSSPKNWLISSMRSAWPVDKIKEPSPWPQLNVSSHYNRFWNMVHQVCMCLANLRMGRGWGWRWWGIVLAVGWQIFSVWFAKTSITTSQQSELWARVSPRFVGQVVSSTFDLSKWPSI